MPSEWLYPVTKFLLTLIRSLNLPTIVTSESCPVSIILPKESYLYIHFSKKHRDVEANANQLIRLLVQLLNDSRVVAELDTVDKVLYIFFMDKKVGITYELIDKWELEEFLEAVKEGSGVKCSSGGA